MVHELGATTFEFKDDNQNKFKVQVGHILQCSCTKTQKSQEHCVHTLYVLQKIFKRDKNDPLLWQKSYTDSEITELVNSRFNINNGQNV